MANLNGFNANEVAPSQDFEPVPAGKYLAVISGSVMKDTKSGQGQYLEITFQILDGPCKGRLVWARLNLVNSNATTVQIARQELSAICRAVGVMTPQDSVELHNIPLVISVTLKPRKDDPTRMTNEVKGFAKREAAGQSPQSSTMPAGNAYAGTTPPWRR